MKYICRCTLKGLADLQLDDDKKGLMKNTQFYQLLNVKEKATSLFLVHKFFECYKVTNKHFEVMQKIVSIDVSDIERIIGLNAIENQGTSMRRVYSEIFRNGIFNYVINIPIL